MMITAISGSPKPKDSNSEQFIHAVGTLLDEKVNIHTYAITKSCIQDEEIMDVIQSDVVLLAFPLYVDGIPANMLKQLIELEKAFHENSHKDTVIYVIVNNGFYEAEQNVNAIEMIKNFCQRAGVRFGQGLGVGTGEMIGGLLSSGMPIDHMLLKDFGEALKVFAHNISTRQSGDPLYASANIQWEEFQTMGATTFWNPKAEANGLSLEDVKRKIEYRK